jgi:hypothetical protein
MEVVTLLIATSVQAPCTTHIPKNGGNKLRHKSAAAYGAKQNKSEVGGKRNTNKEERITEEARKERKMHTIM